MEKWLLDHLPETVATTLVSILGWLSLRHIGRVDNHGRRIAELESDRVTRADLDELRETYISGQQRTEDKLERIWQQISNLSRD